MPRLGDFPLTVVRVACLRCGRRGQYRLARLVARFGYETSMEALLERIAGSCPNFFRVREGRPVCGAHFPDLANEVERRHHLGTAGYVAPAVIDEMWPFKIELPSPREIEVIARARHEAVARAAFGAAVAVHPDRCVMLLRGTKKVTQHG